MKQLHQPSDPPHHQPLSNGSPAPGIISEVPNWLPDTPLVGAFFSQQHNDGVKVRSNSPAFEAHFPDASIVALVATMALMRARMTPSRSPSSATRYKIVVNGMILPNDIVIVTPKQVYVANSKTRDVPVISGTITLTDVLNTDPQLSNPRELDHVSEPELFQGEKFRFVDLDTVSHRRIGDDHFFHGRYTIAEEWCGKDGSFDTSILPEVAAQMASAVAREYFGDGGVVLTFAKCDLTVANNLTLRSGGILSGSGTLFPEPIEGSKNHCARIVIKDASDTVVLVGTITGTPLKMEKLPRLRALTVNRDRLR